MKFNVETTITSPGIMAIMSSVLDAFCIDWLAFEKIDCSSFMIAIEPHDLHRLESALDHDERVIKYSLAD